MGGNPWSLLWAKVEKPVPTPLLVYKDLERLISKGAKQAKKVNEVAFPGSVGAN